MLDDCDFLFLIFSQKTPERVQDIRLKRPYLCYAKTDYRARLVVQKAAKSSLSFFDQVTSKYIRQPLFWREKWLLCLGYLDFR